VTEEVLLALITGHHNLFLVIVTYVLPPLLNEIQAARRPLLES
jgi:hypothetical protein